MLEEVINRLIEHVIGLDVRKRLPPIPFCVAIPFHMGSIPLSMPTG